MTERYDNTGFHRAKKYGTDAPETLKTRLARVDPLPILFDTIQ
jgi:hypothetical protein